MSFLRLLIVEDSKAVATLLRIKLKAEFDCEAVFAYSFKEAIDILNKDANFSLALLDLNLPDAPNGEIVDFVMGYKIPAIVMTATFSADTRKRILSKKVVDYVVKDSVGGLEYIFEVIKRFNRNRNVKILLVDDSNAFRKRCLNILANQNYHVLQAVNGKAALAIIEKHPDIKLIITDYNMPEMDGIELISVVRKRLSKDKLAIIGLSANEEQSLSVTFLKLGANDYLSKDFVQEEFIARVTQNIEIIELIYDLREAAIKDHMTKLYNRRYFFKEAEERYQASRKSGLHVSTAMLDIDFFKKINDTYGHDGGDLVLKYFAELLKRTFADYPYPHIISRFGGEEFCILLEDADDQTAFSMMEDLRTKVESSKIQNEDKFIRFTVSAGVADNSYPSLEKAIKAADERLYQAKQGGRNRIVF